MSVYAISDIHGAYDEFRALLRKIEFRFDGSDQLYLLGDYGDWGRKSIETIQFVRALDERYDFVHCLMGNHEAMFLQTILGGCEDGRMSASDANWIFTNRGLITWQGYLELPEEEKRGLTEWLKGLRYSFDVTVGGTTYMMAHAYPYFYDELYTPQEAMRHKKDALWRRLLLRENPFASYHGAKRYDMLICGHTISDVYFQQLRGEKNWPYRKPAQTVRNRIFRAEMFIDIDCGAKCMDMLDEGDVLQIAAMRAQLACLRLDDGMGIYVHRRLVRTDENGNREVVLPDVRLPEVKLPEVKLPEVRLPDVKIPEMKFPDVRLRDMKLSDLRLRDIKLAGIRLSDLHLPVFEDPDPWEDFE